MNKLLLSLILLAFSFSHSIAQQSAHEQDMLAHPDLGIVQIPAQKAPRPHEKANCDLNKMVFGWHPYWVNGLEANYDWNLISDLCYFSYEVDPATGNASSTHGFATNDAIDTALAHGVDVHLCVTLFSSHATFFGNSAAQTTLINNLINLIQARGAIGINIDFEGVPSSQSGNLTTFMINLGTAMHAANPNYKLSICLYAVDWNNVFNEPALNAQVDFYTIMGYDYYYSGSSQTGPNDPLYGFTNGYDYSLSRSVSYYLNEGIPENKLVLGLPYYGKEWETTSNAIPSPTTGNNNFSRTYSVVKNNVSGNYSNPNQITRPSTKAYVFQNAGTWRQCWISEADELKDRYELVNRRNLKGIGIWTLGYDDGYNELWDAIEEKLTTCRTWACSDTLYDEGGPEGDYYNRELVTYTISPPGATGININFLEFSTELNYDTLWLYDGASTSAPLIGFYHGTTGPGQFTTTSGQITLHFKSDGSTRSSGWKMAYNCIQDNTPPGTLVTSNNTWQTQDETINFTDTDNIGVVDQYWNAQTLTNGTWKSNANTGHVSDEFQTLGTWQAVTGTWTIGANGVSQTDEVLSNTNLALFAPLTSSDNYIFEFEGSISGTGTNRRAGMHYMCSDLTLPNHGNSYFIYYRVDSDVIQLYKVVNDVFTLTASFPFTINPGELINSKVLYSLQTGELTVYANDSYIGSWTDSSPLTASNGVALRNGNCAFTVNLVRVHIGRTTSELLTVGGNSHFYECNPSVTSQAGKIVSLVIDAAHNIGSSESVFDVDFTSPILTIPTENATDTDTLLNTTSLTLSNLVASDTHSGIQQFTCRVEKTDGTLILPDFTVTSNSFFTTLSNLQNQSTYLIRLNATNGAGLSDSTQSDGFIYLNTASLSETEDLGIAIYPNPVVNQLSIKSEKTRTITIFNSLGALVLKTKIEAGKTISIDCSNWASSVYFISSDVVIYKVVKE